MGWLCMEHIMNNPMISVQRQDVQITMAVLKPHELNSTLQKAANEIAAYVRYFDTLQDLTPTIGGR